MSSGEIEVLDAMMKGDDAALIAHAETAPATASLSAVLGRLNMLYENAATDDAAKIEHAPLARRLLDVAERVRLRAGPAQRDVDLHLMRVIRHSGGLCAVIGAGATMDAGGPSWPGLVANLLKIGLDPGFEDVITKVPDKLSVLDLVAGTAERVVGHKQFSGDAAGEARALLEKIGCEQASVEMLMRGAEMCLQLAGQRLFAAITDVLYDDGKRQPGNIHKVIAELAEPIGKPARHFGWSSIITYNFDDLAGEALDRRGLARAAWAMRGTQPRGDPNEAAQKAGEDGHWLPVIHLHGYSPRRFYYITHVKFVFSTSQYETQYGADQRPILDSVFEQFLANPRQYACYVGCSFDDEYMNRLLSDAYQRLPGREHWALLRWPGPTPYQQASGEEIAQQASRYTQFGVRPVWFDNFDDIPALLRRTG